MKNLYALLSLSLSLYNNWLCNILLEHEIFTKRLASRVLEPVSEEYLSHTVRDNLSLCLDIYCTLLPPSYIGVVGHHIHTITILYNRYIYMSTIV